jgi:hypothetical protein
MRSFLRADVIAHFGKKKWASFSRAGRSVERQKKKKEREAKGLRPPFDSTNCRLIFYVSMFSPFAARQVAV